MSEIITSQKDSELLQLVGFRLGKEEFAVDILNVNEILKMCVSGISNAKIAHTTDSDWVYIQSTIFDHLGFSGWTVDLDVSPWRIYCKNAGIKFAYEKEIHDLTKLLDDDIIDVAYRVCSIYSSIRNEMEIFYERS